ncbi:hypothetical protein GCM10027592_46770 [Spirosoma flavus]
MNKKTDKTVLSPARIEQVYEAILVKKYKLGDINEVEKDLTSRNLNLWGGQNLLLAIRHSDSTWSRFSLADYLWIKILLAMSALNVNKKKAELIKSYLLLLPQPAVIPNLSSKALNVLKNGGETINQPLAVLAGIIAESIWHKRATYIHLYEDTCLFTATEGIIPSLLIGQYPESETYIQISLQDIFADFVYNMMRIEMEKDPVGIGILTTQEGALLQDLEQNQLSHIEVTATKEETWGIDINDANKGRLAHALSLYMVKGNYEHITYLTAKGESFTLSRATKAPITN